MAASLEETLISVWRQAMVEGAKTVTVEDGNFPMPRTSRSRLREVDFQFQGHALHGLEQNPETSSRWARLARGGGKKLCSFSADAATLRLWWTERCSSMENRGWMNWKGKCRGEYERSNSKFVKLS
jgi:hypothetical protein